MRLLMGMLAIVLLAAFGPVTTAAAQCTMFCPNGQAKEAQKGTKLAKPAKKPKERPQYMRY